MRKDAPRFGSILKSRTKGWDRTKIIVLSCVFLLEIGTNTVPFRNFKLFLLIVCTLFPL